MSGAAPNAGAVGGGLVVRRHRHVGDLDLMPLDQGRNRDCNPPEFDHDPIRVYFVRRAPHSRSAYHPS